MSKTAVSTQPPLTEPARSPPLETAIVAPTGRGAEPSTRTTVAIATRCPAARQASTSGRNSLIACPPCVHARDVLWIDLDRQLATRTNSRDARQLLSCGTRQRALPSHRRLVVDVAEHSRQCLHALQIMDRQEQIDIRQGRANTLRERLIARRTKERVQPNQPPA